MSGSGSWIRVRVRIRSTVTDCVQAPLKKTLFGGRGGKVGSGFTPQSFLLVSALFYFWWFSVLCTCVVRSVG
jgi:hypothetical protein